MENMELWNKVKTPPKDALKKIVGGRLRGMTDISPQWRLEVLTEQFGPVGVGWYYTIDKQWMEEGSNGEIAAFVNISLFVRSPDTEWSKPIAGTGGSKFIAKERNGHYTSDEVYKMAVTDAISVACKSLGIASDVYRGMMDGSKYNKPKTEEEKFKGSENKEHIYMIHLSKIHEELTIEGVDKYCADNAGKIKKELGGTEYQAILSKDVEDHKRKILETKKAVEEVTV